MAYGMPPAKAEVGSRADPVNAPKERSGPYGPKKVRKENTFN